MGSTLFDSGNAPLVLSKAVIPAGGSSNPSELLSGPLDAAYQLVSVQGVPQLVGSTSCAFMIGKVSGSQPVGSATPMLTATLNMVSSQDIVLTGAPIGSQPILQLAQGDRLVLMKSGYWPTTCIIGVTCVLRRN